MQAISHPLRVKMLALLRSRSMTVGELAREVGATPSSVRYHARKLRSLGFVTGSAEPGRREASLRLAAEPGMTDDIWAQTPTIVKEATVASTLAHVGATLDEAVARGGFDRADAHLTRSRVRLDERGWTRLTTDIADFVETVDRLGAEAEQRLAKSRERPIEATVLMMCFETPADFLSGRPAADAPPTMAWTLTDAEWAQTPLPAKRTTLLAAVGRIKALLASAVTRGAFNRGGATLKESTVRLDQRAWTWLATEMLAWLDVIDRAEIDALPRIGEGAPALDATLTLFLFEAAAAPPQPAAAPNEDEGLDSIFALHEQVEKLLITGQDWDRSLALLDELRVAARDRLIEDRFRQTNRWLTSR